MLRLRKNLQFRIPNKLAGLSAVLLLITALTGASSGFSGVAPSGQSTEAAVNQQAVVEHESQNTLQNKRPKKFKVSLMLFPAN